MEAAITLDELLADLQAMQAHLGMGELETVEHSLVQHDRKVREFIHGPGGRAASREQLAALLHAQYGLERNLRQSRDQVAGLMQASSKADRAARAYLVTEET
jgi:hypothetical protein